MQIIARNFPILVLQFSKSQTREVNIGNFLASVIKDPNSPYFNILTESSFEKVYVENDQLIWPEVLDATVCSGEIQKHNAVFSQTELLKYLRESNI